MHETYMKRAISEALKGKGQTFTNPLVGAVIVKDEEIVAVGSHMAYGQPHGLWPATCGKERHRFM